MNKQPPTTGGQQGDSCRGCDKTTEGRLESMSKKMRNETYSCNFPSQVEDAEVSL